MAARQLVGVLLAALAATAAGLSETTTPLLIADGGSSCQVPEQTVQAFKLAIENGADFLGITVVSTKDGALVCRPDITLDGNTNIAQDKSLRGRDSVQTLPDGRKKAGHFVSDYTLAEVQSLWAVQDFRDRDQSFNADFRVPELKEVLDLVAAAVAGGRKLGIAVHVKEPQYHQAINVNLEQAIIEAITGAGFSADKFPTEVILTSFYLPVLEALRSELDKIKVAPKASLVWKIDCSEGDVSDADLETFAAYGFGIAPEKELLEQLTFAEECGKLIMPPCWKTGDHCTGKLVHAYNPADPAQPTTLLSRAHDRGLKVYPYTFRNEARYMAVDFHADMQKELNYFAGPNGMGVDGVYLDCPSSGVEWLAGLQYAAKRAAAQTNGASPAASPAPAAASPHHNAAPLLGGSTAATAGSPSPVAAEAPNSAANAAAPAPAVSSKASDAAAVAASPAAESGTAISAPAPAVTNAGATGDSAGSSFKQAFTDKVPLWTLAVTAGGVMLVLLLGLCLARCTRRRPDSYRQFKESSLRDPLETADLPVSTGAEWGLQKSRWGASRDRASDASSEMEAPPSTTSQGRAPNTLATYSGFLRKYTDMSGNRQPPP